MVKRSQAIWLLIAALLLGVLSQSTAAQDKPSATRIGKHHLGETFEEWLAVGNLTTPAQACPALEDLGQMLAGSNHGRLQFSSAISWDGIGIKDRDRHCIIINRTII